MALWQAKKLKLPNHNFETTAIKFEDGRVGLCYHGSTIWDDASGGWEDFIENDWNEVWKKGRLCTFKELPSDMRIACPACGAKINPEDAECLKCGVIFERMKEEPARTETPEEEVRESPRSKVVDISLVSLVLLIAAFFIYNALKPEPPQTVSSPRAPAEEESLTGMSEQPFRQSNMPQNIPAERPDIGADSPGAFPQPASVPTLSPEEAAMEAQAFYRHINLDDLETASRQLREETYRLNQEGVQINEIMNAPESTPEKIRQAREDKIRYDYKAMELSRLIKEFNARNESAP